MEDDGFRYIKALEAKGYKFSGHIGDLAKNHIRIFRKEGRAGYLYTILECRAAEIDRLIPGGKEITLEDAEKGWIL